MDPVGKGCEDNVGDQGAQDSKDHNVREVLEEPLAAHVVSGSKDDRRDAEVKEHVVIEDYVLLDHIVVRQEGTTTNKETQASDITGLMPEMNSSGGLLLAYDHIEQNQAEKQK